METETSMQTDQLADLLAQRLEADRVELVNCYRQSLRDNLFSNRTEVHPRELTPIAAEEADTLIRSLSRPFESGREHGVQLCQLGLSDQTVVSLGRVTRQFSLTHCTSAEMVKALNIVDLYENGVVQGYVQAREKLILAEQERIRGALQVAVSRYTVEIKEVQEIAKRANEANEFKSQFIARMSHELRTPLGALLGLAEMLQHNVYGPLTPPQLDIVQRIISNAEGLKQVFTELLDESQIEAGQLRLKEKAFSPETLAKRVNTNYLAMAIEKGLSMHVEVVPGLPQTLIGDEARTEQILSNLVVNAIKFTRKGGVIIRVFKFDRSQWAMQVKDTGIGVDAEKQAQIFEPFRQAEETTSRAYGGVGLGLAIAQQLVRAMNGSIHLESKPGQGSTFTVYLPIRESETR